MIITKEQQEAMINNYAKNHNSYEVVGFVDGLNAMLELIEKLDQAKKNNLIN